MEKKSKEHKIKKITWVRIKHGDDLSHKLSDFCLENKIKLGFVSIIGALQKASFSFYDQEEKKYSKSYVNEPVEILSCLGNVSVKEGKPFLHAHLSVADKNGNVFGGHLEEGTIIFACECALFELEGDILERKYDQLTGLSLWDFS